MSAPTLRGPALGRLALRLALRHRGRLAFIALCLAAGVASLFAVGNLLATVEAAVAGRSREMLAADLKLGSSRPFGREALAALARLEREEGARVGRSLAFAAMVHAPGGSAARPSSSPGAAPVLTSVKAVEVGAGYPFYGRLSATPPGAEAELTAGGCLAEPALAARLGTAPGGRLRLGGTELRLAGLLLREPDRGLAFFSVGPRLLIPFASVEATGLVRFGSRIRYEALIALPPGAPAERALMLKARLERELRDPHVSVSAYTDAEPSLREALRRVADFFVLVSVVALLLGAAGMAASVAAFLNEQAETAGTLRCLGLAPGEVARLYRALCLAVGAAGGLGGAAGGWVLSAAGLNVARRYLDLPPGGPVLDRGSLGEAVALACGLAVGLNWARVRRLSAMSPLEALRGHSLPGRPTAWGLAALWLLGSGAVFLYIWAKSQSRELSAYFTLGLAAACAAALGGVVLARRGLGSLAGGALSRAPFLFSRRRAPLPLRLGLTHLARQRGTASFLFALTLGFSLLGALRGVHRSLVREILLGRAEGVPNVFLADVQPGQREGVPAAVARHGGSAPEFAPLVRARLTEVNGEKLARRQAGEQTLEERARQRALLREFNLTYEERLRPVETVVAGRFWGPGATGAEISLEAGFAERAGLALGDSLRFDVAGRELEGRVTSLRRVDWMSMRPNFFVVLSPAALGAAPRTLIASLRLREPAALAALGRELASAHPNVALVDVSQFLDNVQATVGVLLAALDAVAWFCVAVGVLVLAGTMSLQHEARRERAAVLRALGLAGRDVLAADAWEFAAVGAFVFAAAAAVALGLGPFIAWRMDVSFRVEPLVLLAPLAPALVLPLAVGLLANRRVYREPPLAVLRGQ